MDSSQDDAEVARRPELPHPNKTMAEAERKVDTERIFIMVDNLYLKEQDGLLLFDTRLNNISSHYPMPT